MAQRQNVETREDENLVLLKLSLVCCCEPVCAREPLVICSLMVV